MAKLHGSMGILLGACQPDHEEVLGPLAFLALLSLQSTAPGAELVPTEPRGARPRSAALSDPSLELSLNERPEAAGPSEAARRRGS
jgi:hypothetical protein